MYVFFCISYVLLYVLFMGKICFFFTMHVWFFCRLPIFVCVENNRRTVCTIFHEALCITKYSSCFSIIKNELVSSQLDCVNAVNCKLLDLQTHSETSRHISMHVEDPVSVNSSIFFFGSRLLCSTFLVKQINLAQGLLFHF